MFRAQTMARIGFLLTKRLTTIPPSMLRNFLVMHAPCPRSRICSGADGNDENGDTSQFSVVEREGHHPDLADGNTGRLRLWRWPHGDLRRWKPRNGHCSFARTWNRFLNV